MKSPQGRVTARLVGVSLVAAAISLPLPARAQPEADAFSFDQLIDRAPLIVVATTTSRRAEWEFYGSSKLIITKVTMEVEQSLKGSAPRTLTVEVMGGTIGDQTQKVFHVPEFRVGDRDVLFLNNHPHSVSPLVGSDQGRFRVMNESAGGTARVLTVGFFPLRSVAEVGAAAASGAAGSTSRSTASLASALSLSDFVTIVRDRVRLLERR